MFLKKILSSVNALLLITVMAFSTSCSENEVVENSVGIKDLPIVLIPQVPTDRKYTSTHEWIKKIDNSITINKHH